MIKFQIATYKEYLDAEQQKKNLLKEIDLEFKKQFNSNIVNLNKSIVLSIIDKLNVLIEQYSNSVIATAEKNKANSLKELEQTRHNFYDEMENILGLLTSNLNQKKRVTKVSLATSEASEGEKYLAYLGENGTSYCLVLNEKINIDLAKRYLAIYKELDKLDELKKTTLEDFKKSIKDYDYVENNFSKELNFLEEVSKFSDLYRLEDLDPEEYYLLIANNEDYDSLKEQLIAIQDLKKQLNNIINK